MIITKEFMKDFRNCNQVIIRFTGPYVRIELDIKKGYDTVKSTIYEYKDKYLPENEKAFWYIPYKDSSTIEVLRYVLKKDDELRFYNYKNGTENLKRAGLHYDELCCKIKRKDNFIIQRLVLDVSICEDNSGRAIQKM